jgi:hypothetical protein
MHGLRSLVKHFLTRTRRLPIKMAGRGITRHRPIVGKQPNVLSRTYNKAKGYANIGKNVIATALVGKMLTMAGNQLYLMHRRRRRRVHDAERLMINP